MHVYTMTYVYIIRMVDSRLEHAILCYINKFAHKCKLDNSGLSTGACYINSDMAKHDENI